MHNTEKLLNKLSFAGVLPSWQRQLDSLPLNNYAPFVSPEVNSILPQNFKDNEIAPEYILYAALDLTQIRGLRNSIILCYLEITTQRLLPFNRHVLLLIQNNKLKFSSGDFGLLQTLLGQFDDVADNDFVLEADWELVYTLVSQNKLIVNSLGDTRPIALYKSCTDSDQEDVEFCLSIELNTEADKSWKVWGYLLFKQSNKKVCLWDVTSIHHPNIFLMDHCFYHFTTPLYLPLMKHFHEGGGLMIPLDELPLFIQEVFNKFGQCPISSGESLKIDNEIEAPTPLFYINTKSLAVSGQLWFRYGNKEFPSTIHNDDRNGILAGVLNSRFSSRPDLTAGIASYTLHLSWPDFDREYDHFKAVHRRPGLRFEKANKTFSINSDEALNLIYRLLELGVEVWAENLQVKILENYIFNIMAQENWFEIDMINSYSRNQKIESWQLIHLLKKQSLFLRLDDGTIGVLPEKWMLLLQDLFRYSKDGHFSFAATPHFEDLKTQFADLFTGDEKFQKLAMEFKNIAKLEGVPASSRFKSTLRKYQEQGLAWLIFLDKLNLGGLLADEMGLGKTVQILAFLDHTMAEVVTARPATLIVAPKSLTEYWYRETQRFCPHLRVKILNTFEIQNQTCENLASNDYADIFIISYGLARRNISILRLLTFDYIILDEAQVIKNPAAQTTIAVKQLNSNKKLALTGTPIENHLGDLCSIIDFLNPRLLPENIAQELCSVHSPKEVESFFRGIRPFVLRRLKSEVLNDLPDKFEEVVSLQMHPNQMKVYNDLKISYQQQLAKIDNEQVFREYKMFFLEGLLRLKQVASHPRLLNKEQVITEVCDSNKIEFLRNKVMALLLSEEKHKILIFSQFVSFLSIIKTVLDEEKILYEYLDGSTNNRQAVVDNFQNNETIKVFLISLKAGGLGLNLTAADYAFIMDTWWNPAVEKQAIDRLHRIGQMRKVFVYKVISQHSIEEKIIKMHEHKLRQADFLQASDEAFFENMSIDDMKYFFSD